MVTAGADGHDRWRAGGNPNDHGGGLRKSGAVAKIEPRPERLSEPFDHGMVEGRQATAGRGSGHSGSAHVRISSQAILKETYPHPLCRFGLQLSVRTMLLRRIDSLGIPQSNRTVHRGYPGS